MRIEEDRRTTEHVDRHTPGVQVGLVILSEYLLWMVSSVTSLVQDFTAAPSFHRWVGTISACLIAFAAGFPFVYIPRTDWRRVRGSLIALPYFGVTALGASAGLWSENYVSYALLPWIFLRRREDE